MGKNECRMWPFECCINKVKYTNRIPSRDFKESGKFPIISQEESFISGYWDNPMDVFHVENPVVIFGDHSRHVKYVDFDFVIGADGVKILSPVKEIVPKYFFYFLKWVKVPSLGYSRHYKALKEKTVPVPSITEQQRIVEELDLLSGIIEKKKAQAGTLDNLARSFFYEMFGNPILNERHWPTQKMKDVAPQNKFNGQIPDERGKYWLLNLDMIASQTGNILEKVLFDSAEIGNSTTTFNEENILYSKLRPYLNKVVIPMEPGYCTSELVPLLPKKNLVDRIFLAYLLRSPHFVEYINSRVAGAKMPRVNMTDFREVDVILPPIELQQQFARKIEAITKHKETINTSIIPAQKLFDSRLDTYFNE